MIRIIAIVLVTLPIELLGQTTDYRLQPEPNQHNFVLVMDRSGSMKGMALKKAIEGARDFIAGMKSGDKAAVVAFDSNIEVIEKMTADHQALHRALGQIRSGGATVLYDALARAAGMLQREQGRGIIVFLTDGSDTGSRYSIDDLEGMSLSEGLFIYGIGLGKVDGPALNKLSEITGGFIELTGQPDGLGDLYERVLDEFYTSYGSKPDVGSYAIRSLPKGRAVRVGGRVVGHTPVKLDNWPQGDHEIEVEFDRGIWQGTAPAVPGQRTIVDAREDDLGYDLWVISRPHGATVFLDDAYVGLTSLYPVQAGGKKWGKKVIERGRQLRIPLVPKGKHALRLLAMPDFDFGPEQEIAFEISIEDRERVLLVDILQGRLLWGDGRKVKLLRSMPNTDPFEELDSETEE